MIWATLKIINFRILKWEFWIKLQVLQICKFITQAYNLWLKSFNGFFFLIFHVQFKGNLILIFWILMVGS